MLFLHSVNVLKEVSQRTPTVVVVELKRLDVCTTKVSSETTFDLQNDTILSTQTCLKKKKRNVQQGGLTCKELLADSLHQAEDGKQSCAHIYSIALQEAL